MKFAIFPHGPVDRLMEKARQLNPRVPVLILDESSFSDPELLVVFAFRAHHKQVEAFNIRRVALGLPKFSIVDVPVEEMPRKPRVVRSSIRARLAELLSEGPAYGYELYKKYREKYGAISLRLVYYHLERGVKEGLFEVADVRKSKGSFSWGESSRHIYYRLKARDV